MPAYPMNVRCSAAGLSGREADDAQLFREWRPGTVSISMCWGLARSERFELPTLGFEVRCSIQLSYERMWPDYQTWLVRASRRRRAAARKAAATGERENLALRPAFPSPSTPLNQIPTQ
jgi:hypothetical protein